MTQSLRGANSPGAHIDVATSKPTDANSIQIGGTHYSGGSYQHWDLATDLHLRHLEGAATKYLSRFGNKPGESAFKDLQKARHYLTKLIEVYSEDRIHSQSLNLEHRKVDKERTKADLTRFLSALSGPPADLRSQNAIIKICLWRSRIDLEEALTLVDSLIDEHNTDAPTSGETAQTKERTE